MAQVLTVFRSRLRDDVPAEYWTLADELETLARTLDGFVEYKTFTADDGERLALAVFDSEASEAVWRDHAAHRAAQQRGRDEFYLQYDVSVCERRSHHWWGTA